MWVEWISSLIISDHLNRRLYNNKEIYTIVCYLLTYTSISTNDCPDRSSRALGYIIINLTTKINHRFLNYCSAPWTRLHVIQRMCTAWPITSTFIYSTNTANQIFSRLILNWNKAQFSIIFSFSTNKVCKLIRLDLYAKRHSSTDLRWIRIDNATGGNNTNLPKKKGNKKTASLSLCQETGQFF